jgi:hypothetical protein
MIGLASASLHVTEMVGAAFFTGGKQEKNRKLTGQETGGAPVFLRWFC